MSNVLIAFEQGIAARGLFVRCREPVLGGYSYTIRDLPDFLKRVAEKFEAVTAQRLAENAAWRQESRRKARC